LIFTRQLELQQVSHARRTRRGHRLSVRPHISEERVCKDVRDGDALARRDLRHRCDDSPDAFGINGHRASSGSVSRRLCAVVASEETPLFTKDVHAAANREQKTENREHAKSAVAIQMDLRSISRNPIPINFWLRNGPLAWQPVPHPTSWILWAFCNHIPDALRMKCLLAVTDIRPDLAAIGSSILNYLKRDVRA
jgi:hypothetical protein